MRHVRIFSTGVAVAVGLAGCATNFKDSLSGDSERKDGDSRVSEASVGEVAQPSTPSAGRLQQQVMDFSDRFSNDLRQSISAYIAAEPDIAKQVQAQRLRLGLDTTSMTIAASLDPRANLLDMAVFISAGKWAADTCWVPSMLGEKAAGLRAVYASADREIWGRVDAILTPAQAADLRALIEEWKKTADPHDVVNVRLRNLDGVVLSHFQESASAKGLLASVRRLLGRVDQSLLYGERMMFYLERAPLVLSQQADLTVDRVAERFPIATVNPDFAAWSQAAQDFGNALPQKLSDALTPHEDFLRDTLPGIQASLGSAEHIFTSLQGTIASTDSLAAKLEKLPFTQADYLLAMDRTAVSLDKLNSVVEGLNLLADEDASKSGESRVTQLARLLDERTDRVLDSVFQRIAILIAMFIGGLLVVLVAARLLFRPPAAVAAEKPDGIR